MKRVFSLLVLSALLSLLLAACQAVFTYSPLSFLQRDPANLPLEQKMEWARAALAGGDTEAIEKAYDALKDDASGSTDAELTLLTATLAMNLSGLPNLAFEMLQENIDFNDETDLDNFFQTLQSSYMLEAAVFYNATLTNDPDELNATEFLLGSACLLYEAADGNGGTLTGLVQADIIDAQTFVDTGLAANPGNQFLTKFNDFLDSF